MVSQGAAPRHGALIALRAAAAAAVLAAASPSAPAGDLAGDARRLGNPWVLMPGAPQPAPEKQPTAGGLPMLTPGQSAMATNESSQFIGAMVKSFLNKQQLQPGELDCITSGSKDVGGNVGQLASQAGMIMQKMFGKNIPGVPDSPSEGTMPAPAPAPAAGADSVAASAGSLQASGKTVAAKAQGDISKFWFNNKGRRLQMMPSISSQKSASGPAPAQGVSVGAMMPMAMELGYNMKQITEETHALVGKCVHSDAQQAFKTAGAHMQDLNYMTGHILANGGDIVQELADSVLAYQSKDPARFGNDFGVAMRKVLLSSDDSADLPEGRPGAAELANVTGGMLNKFFGPGTNMNIAFSKDPKNPAHIDMHNCIGQNLGLFQNAYGSTMHLFAQKSVGAKNAPMPADSPPQPSFGTTVAQTMMSLPSALDKCNIDSKQKGMIMDGIKSLGHGMKMDLDIPQKASQVSKKDVMEDFAQTINDWGNHNWYQFGQGLGRVMQEGLAKKFPQQYSISEEGVLIMHKLEQPAGAGDAALLVLPGALLIGGVALSMTRRVRAGSRTGDVAIAQQSIEEGSYLEVE